MKSRLLLPLLLVVIVFVCSCSKEDTTPEPFKPGTSMVMNAGCIHNGRIVVKLNERGVSQTKSLGSSLPDIGIYSIEPLFPENKKFAQRHKKAGLDKWKIINFNTETPINKAYNEISKIGIADLIEYVPVIAQSQNNNPFNDPNLMSQWHYYNASGTGDINLKNAWEISTGSEAIIVAIIDSGVDYKHDDLKGAMWTNEAEFRGKTGFDDDDNGYVDDIYGYNFTVTDNSSEMIGTIVPESHGTHVAGTVGAINNNGKFGAGIAGGNGITKGVRLMSCQTIQEKNGAYISAAFVYAADNGAVITQNSWELLEVPETPQYIKEAIDYFNTYAGIDIDGNQVGPMAGGITIFAAGNSNTIAAYPAMEDNVIAVSSIGPQGIKASYSNFGNWVDIAAPGGDGGGEGYVFSTLPNNQFGGMQGTSMACPHVSGVAALVVSKYGGIGFTNSMLKDRLLKTANEEKLYKYNAQYKNDKRLGLGLLDAYAALMPTTVPSIVTNIQTSVVSNTITLNWEASGNGEYNTYGYNIYFSKYDLSEYDESSIATGSNVSVAFIKADNIKAGENVSATIKSDFNTDIYIRIQALNHFGDGSPLSLQVKVRTQANNAPVFTPGESFEISLKSFEIKTFEFTASDPDGHKLEKCTFNGGSAAATHAQTDDKVTITINAAKATYGKYKATLTVSDEYGAATSLDITYTILPNTPPDVIKGLDNMVFGKGESVSLDLTEYFTDADGEKLIYNIESSESSVTDYGIVGNALTISGRSFGSTQMKVIAKDAKNEEASIFFTVLVRDKNIPVDIYPNPVRNELFVRAGTDGTYQLSIIGSHGGTIYSNPSLTTGPFSPFKVNASEWGIGSYIVVLKSGSNEYKTNIVKL